MPSRAITTWPSSTMTLPSGFPQRKRMEPTPISGEARLTPCGDEYDRAISDFDDAIRLGGSAAHGLVSRRDIRGYLESQFSAAYAHALRGDAHLVDRQP